MLTIIRPSPGLVQDFKVSLLVIVSALILMMSPGEKDVEEEGGEGVGKVEEDQSAW